jgi:hypothetical protein
MTADKVWLITTTGDRPIGDVAEDLTRAGLVGARILKDIGCITGSAPEKQAAKLRQVRGVGDVSPDQPIDIGPPGSRTTW